MRYGGDEPKTPLTKPVSTMKIFGKRATAQPFAQSQNLGKPDKNNLLISAMNASPNPHSRYIDVVHVQRKK